MHQKSIEESFVKNMEIHPCCVAVEGPQNRVVTRSQIATEAVCDDVSVRLERRHI